MEWLVRDVPGKRSRRPAISNLAKQTLRLLRNQSNKVNADGRIVHEITPDGAVSNPGNTQETAQFVLTVGKVFQWTGDQDFAREMYPAVKSGIDWLLGEADHCIQSNSAQR